MAKIFTPWVHWNDDLGDRQNALDAFASFSRTEVQDGDLVWGDGLYLLLHFDLITITPGDDDLDRSDTYKAINTIVVTNRGTRLGGSVYILPLLPRMSSKRCAIRFWNALGLQLDGLLVLGDSFFLHYAPDGRNLMGGIAEIVGDDETLRQIPEVLA